MSFCLPCHNARCAVAQHHGAAHPTCLYSTLGRGGLDRGYVQIQFPMVTAPSGHYQRNAVAAVTSVGPPRTVFGVLAAHFTSLLMPQETVWALTKARFGATLDSCFSVPLGVSCFPRDTKADPRHRALLPPTPQALSTTSSTAPAETSPRPAPGAARTSACPSLPSSPRRPSFSY